MAQTAYINGRIYTMNDAQPWAEALLVSGERIAAVGSTADILAQAAADATIVDLAGRFVMPGFTDAHLHFLWGAQYLDCVGLRDARTFAEVLQRLEAYAGAHPERAWIQGQEFSYGYPDLPESGFHKSMLDAIVPDRPVYFYSGMAHAAWANSKALELAGITRDTPDPENGVIVRDENGEPTGWLKEHAGHLVGKLLPASTPQSVAAVLPAAIAEANRLGLTRVQSAGFDDEMWDVLAELRDTDALSLRFTLSQIINPPDFPQAQLETMLALKTRYDDDYLDFRVAKFFLDGVLESHTGYMPEGYADRPEEKGILLWDEAAYSHAVKLAQDHGFQVWTHAIGTGASHVALNAYAADLQQSRSLRPRVEHIEVPTMDDMARLKDIGAIASLQPAMIYPKDQWMGMQGIWEVRAGPDCMKRAFPLRSILDQGGALAFGTDWPIVDLNPLVGIRNAVLRQSFDHEPENGWVPEQRITVAEALRAYTLGAAFAGHRETDEGSLEPGKLADLILLSDDPLAIDPDRIAGIRVLATVVGGRVVYGSF